MLVEKNKKEVVLDRKKLAAKLKEMRLRNGFTIRDIQNFMGMNSPEAIYSYEQGKYLPTLNNIAILARLYGCTIDELIWSD